MSKTNTAGSSGDKLRQMTEEEVLAAAYADPDAQPMTPDDFKRMKRTPQVSIIRRALKLTQEQFSERFHIPVGTLRDWEQGRAEPDQPARTLLYLIARDARRVARMLNRPHSAA
jgi:putative transcriptional regulator